ATWKIEPDPRTSSRFIASSGLVANHRSPARSGSIQGSSATSPERIGVLTSRSPSPRRYDRTALRAASQTCTRSGQASGSLIDAFYVITSPGVDLELVADLDEQRDLNLVAGLHGRALGHVGRGVALDPGLALRHFHDHVARQREPDRSTVVEQNVDGQVVHQEARVVADQRGLKLDLLVGGAVHEGERVAARIQVLVLARLDVGGLELLTRSPGPVDHRARDHVPDLAFVETLALAGLDELELGDDPRLGVDLQFGVLLELGDVHRRPLPTTFGASPPGRSLQLGAGSRRENAALAVSKRGGWPRP